MTGRPAGADGAAPQPIAVAEGGAPAGAPSVAARERGLSLLQVTNVLIRNRYLAVVLPLVLGGLSVAMSLSQPRMYRAAGSFVPNAAGDAQGSQLNSIASQLGISFSGAPPGQSPAFYGELLQTRDILRDAVQSRYEVEIDGRKQSGTLIHFFGLDQPGAQGDESPLDAAIKQLSHSVNPSVNIETGTVRVEVTSMHPALAEAVVRRLIYLTQDFDLNKRRTQAAARRQFAEARLAEGRTELRRAENALEGYLATHRLFQTSPVQMLEQTKLQQEMALRQQVYAALAQAYEQARMDEVRNTPVITVLENPEGSAQPQARGTGTRAMFGLLLGFLLAVAIGFVREQARNAREARDRDFEEFVSLRRAALGDLWRLLPRPLRPRSARNGAGRGAPAAASSADGT